MIHKFCKKVLLAKKMFNSQFIKENYPQILELLNNEISGELECDYCGGIFSIYDDVDDKDHLEKMNDDPFLVECPSCRNGPSHDDN